MAINKKLIYSQLSKANFIINSNGLNNLTTKDDNGNCGNIPWTSIIWTSDGYMWTHGVWYDCNNTTYDVYTKTESDNRYIKKSEDVSISPVHVHIRTTWPTVSQISDTTSNNISEAAWILSGNSGQLKLPGEGSYLIQITHISNNDNENGLYTGYFSYGSGSGTDDEIVLHRAGNTSTNRLFAKIKYINSGTYLLLAAKIEEADCTGLTIKMKKLL